MKKKTHDSFVFTESESNDGEDRVSDRDRNENTDSENNMDLEIKDLEAFINDKKFENNLKKHFLVVTRNLEKKLR